MKPEQQPTQAIQAVGYQGKSRNVTSGLNLFGQAQNIINFIMFFLGWFTVPVEVLFRKNFGQRWLTGINFYAGLFVLVGFNVLQTIDSAFTSRPPSYTFGQPQQTAPTPSFFDTIMDHSMVLILLAYLAIGSYHFFKIWWGNRTGSALHSFDDGTSRFEPVAIYLMRLVNIIAVPVLSIYIAFLPKSEQRPNRGVPPLTEDLTAFTNTVFEPLLLVVLFFLFRGTTATWLLISAAALALYANWKEAAKLDKVLDFRDAVIAAGIRMAARDNKDKPHETSTTSLENLIMQQVATTVEHTPEVAIQVKRDYPDLMDIIDEMNGGGG